MAALIVFVLRLLAKFGLCKYEEHEAEAPKRELREITKEAKEENDARTEDDLRNLLS